MSKKKIITVAAALLVVVCAVGAFLASGCLEPDVSPLNEVNDVDSESQPSDVDQGSSNDTAVDEADYQEIVNRDNYSSGTEYIDALVEVGKRKLDVPRNIVWTGGEDGKGTGYDQGTLTIYFYRSCEQEEARRIVAENGGLWVTNTYGWATGLDTATVTAYFPDALEENQLEEKRQAIKSYDEVQSAHFAGGYFYSTDSEEDDNELSSDEKQEYLKQSGFDKAWDIVKCSGAVEVAIFDSGIDLDHPDLSENIYTAYDAYNQTYLGGSVQDVDGHGTGVAGVVSAVAGNSQGIDGCSYNALLFPVRVFNDYGGVNWDAVDRAFEFIFAQEKVPEVVNMSFGGSRETFTDEQFERIQYLISEAYENYGMVVVASAGNKGPQDNHYPSAFENVVGVGGLNKDASGLRETSNTYHVDLCAPGTDIYTTANPDISSGKEYSSYSGTSFAAPQVAASAALIKRAHPGYTTAQICQALLETARNDFEEVSDGYGAGALDAGAAVLWSDQKGSGSGDAGGNWSPTAGGSLHEKYCNSLEVGEE